MRLGADRARRRATRSGVWRSTQGSLAHHDRCGHDTASASELRVGLVGPLTLDVPGVAPEHGTLAQVADAPLVLVAAGAAGPGAVADAARAHPASHFALVGESTKPHRVGNLVGLVLRDEQAAQLAGIVAGYAAADAGAAAPRVAWVGPQERILSRRVRARRPSRAAGSHPRDPGCGRPRVGGGVAGDDAGELAQPARRGARGRRGCRRRWPFVLAPTSAKCEAGWARAALATAAGGLRRRSRPGRAAGPATRVSVPCTAAAPATLSPSAPTSPTWSSLEAARRAVASSVVVGVSGLVRGSASRFRAARGRARVPLPGGMGHTVLAPTARTVTGPSSGSPAILPAFRSVNWGGDRPPDRRHSRGGSSLPECDAAVRSPEALTSPRPRALRPRALHRRGDRDVGALQHTRQHVAAGRRTRRRRSRPAETPFARVAANTPAPHGPATWNSTTEPFADLVQRLLLGISPPPRSHRSTRSAPRGPGCARLAPKRNPASARSTGGMSSPPIDPDGRAPTPRGPQTGQVAGQVAGLLLLEDQPLDIRRPVR